jgi:hypothetical protein
MAEKRSAALFDEQAVALLKKYKLDELPLADLENEFAAIERQRVSEETGANTLLSKIDLKKTQTLILKVNINVEPWTITRSLLVDGIQNWTDTVGTKDFTVMKKCHGVTFKHVEDWVKANHTVRGLPFAYDLTAPGDLFQFVFINSPNVGIINAKLAQEEMGEFLSQYRLASEIPAKRLKKIVCDM